MGRTASTAAAVAALLALALAASCRKQATGAGRKDSPTRLERAGEPDFFRTTGDDPEMNAAIRQARATLPRFVKALEQRPFGARGFAIKKQFSRDQHDEFIWLSEVTLEKGGFRGEIDNAAVWATQAKLGDSIMVGKDEVIDWMYVQNGELVGGYTVRVLFKRETPEKQRELEEMFTIPR